jgi:hypothetical protein
MPYRRFGASGLLAILHFAEYLNDSGILSGTPQKMAGHLPGHDLILN